MPSHKCAAGFRHTDLVPEALFRIIQLSHEALISGNLITKRNIYYQNPDLFRSQNVVDDMVDNLAFTLGLGREDLNIVAAAKGLISGPAKATFRTLAASQYCKTSQGGRGILVTAKGFPDLATRRFLSMIHSVKPELKVFALVDFDPHGVAIMRTYKYGSRRLDHEENATIPSLRWLGIRSDDILSAADKDEGYGISLSQSSQDATSQESIAYSFDDSETERPAKRARLSKTNTPSDSVLALTQADRKKAVEILREVAATGEVNVYGLDQRQELQRMLMLNIKAEIQAVDNYGDIADWLDRKLSMYKMFSFLYSDRIKTGTLGYAYLFPTTTSPSDSYILLCYCTSGAQSNVQLVPNTPPTNSSSANPPTFICSAISELRRET
ncbi:endodeoxyribonuclease [Collariella sp. IMI 366227]|nr:endodeoxyribonuclease [Collariella sp. IMI 366227]